MTTLHELVSSGAGGSGLRRVVLGAPAAALVALALAAAATGLAGAAARSDSQPLTLGRVVDVESPARIRASLARTAVVWTGGRTTAATGETIQVYVSQSLPPELGTPETWADFLAGLFHGSELTSLTVYLATLSEVQDLCGPYTLGCYSSDRMVAMGETAAGITAAEVVRHEYGHHVAFHRLNPPWVAVAWGPKHWASTQNVCSRAASGSVFPGDEGDRYRLNPGEAWAETYRLLDERRAGVVGSGWGLVDPSFYPNEATLVAAERDLMAPWTAGRTAIHRYRFRHGTKRKWAIRLVTPLDGAAEIRVVLPPGGLHEVELIDAARGAVLAKALWASARTKTIVTNVCGQRSVSLRITQKGAFGPVRVVARVP